jgi:hypothetical protein
MCFKLFVKTENIILYVILISDLSFNGGSPRTPTKDPQQFIGVPEEHTKEGGSFGSGNESGYSTPDKAKPKKVIYEVVV